jgi:predicted nucleotidyltransferase
MTPIVQEIHSALRSVQQLEQIRVLVACESGSRAWGFASPDSDFDVRFIYCRSKQDYLRVFDQHDCIEQQITGDLDISGWDLKKTLRLIFKSNAVVFEWLQSPVIYAGTESDRCYLLDTAKEFFQPRAVVHHYLGTVDSSLATVSEDGMIRLKKYFYVLRPLLAALWIVRLRTIPPMEFSALLPLLDDRPDIRAIVDELLARKAQSDEKAVIPTIGELQRYISDTRSACLQDAQSIGKREVDARRLDEAFMTILASTSDS